MYQEKTAECLISSFLQIYIVDVLITEFEANTSSSSGNIVETHFGDILLLLRTDGTSLISDTKQNFILSGVLGILRAGDDGHGDDIVPVSE